MPEGKTLLFFIIFMLMALQMLLGMFQVKRYQKAVKGMLGTGILGIGHRKGGWRGLGEILILSYHQGSGKIVSCKSMKGLTIFAPFKEQEEYRGLSLAEARAAGEKLDQKDMGRYRRKHPYNPKLLSKKKGAFIQAVEAIERRMASEREKALDAAMAAETV